MPPNSGVMTQFEVNPNSEIIALLCIGEVADQDNVAFSPLSLLYGKPVIHHFIKALQGVGVSRFCIGIDTVPGALLSYRDSVAAEGLNIEFVREPAALSALLDANSRVLVIRADTLWNTSLVKSMLSRGGPFIAAVEERAENQIFERIDLNNRWSGLAVLERRTLDALPQMPEGWDMASALLRQAVQDGVPLLPVKQSELQSGNVRKLTNIEDASSAVMSLHSGNIDQTNTLEDKLLSYPVSQFLPLLWSVGWGRIVAEWMFPVFALGALSLAIADFVTAATIAAIVAILSAFVRSAARSAEYQSAMRDWIGMGSWAIMAAATYGVFNIVQPAIFDAAFLALALTGLSLLSLHSDKNHGFAMLSPLVIAISFLLGSFVGVVEFAAKLLILVEIGNQLRIGFARLHKV